MSRWWLIPCVLPPLAPAPASRFSPTAPASASRMPGAHHREGERLDGMRVSGRRQLVEERRDEGGLEVCPLPAGGARRLDNGQEDEVMQRAAVKERRLQRIGPYGCCSSLDG